MAHDFTVYTTRKRRLTREELRERLRACGFNVTVAADGDNHSLTMQWYVTRTPTGSDLDTVIDSEVAALDINTDAGLVNGAASSLLLDFEETDDADDFAPVRENLRAARESVFTSVGDSPSPGVRTLQVASLASCLAIGGGVLHDSRNDEFFSMASLRTFLTRELANDGTPIADALINRA